MTGIGVEMLRGGLFLYYILVGIDSIPNGRIPWISLAGLGKMGNVFSTPQSKKVILGIVGLKFIDVVNCKIIP
jgi:hypothetical protein